MGGKIRVAVVYRVCQHWRAPIFAKLNSRNDLCITVFNSKGIPGTKLVNGDNLEGFEHQAIFTLSGYIRSSERSNPFVFCPTIGFHLMRHNPDVILVEGGSNVLTNVFVYAYAKLFNKPIVWWTLGELPGRKFSGLGKVYRKIVTRMERSATALLGYSTVAIEYFGRMGYPREKCFKAVNCVDTDKVFREIEQSRERVELLRDKLGLRGKRVILFVGALTKEKAVCRLIKGFAGVQNEHRDAVLLIVGDGPDRTRLENMVNESGISQKMKLVGQVITEVAAYYELGDIFVMPGLGGLVISEAMAHGLPIICSQGDGCEVDLVEDGRTGFHLQKTAEEDIVNELTKKLKFLLDNEEKRKEMGEHARDIIINRYNVHTYLDGIAAAIGYAYQRRGR